MPDAFYDKQFQKKKFKTWYKKKFLVIFSNILALFHRSIVRPLRARFGPMGR